LAKLEMVRCPISGNGLVMNEKQNGIEII